MLKSVSFTDVEIADRFWSTRREANRVISLPLSFDKLEESGALSNMDLAAAHSTDGFRGPVFADSDIYKALEAAACSLAADPDDELESRVDQIIDRVAAAQLPDGYLNTAYQVDRGIGLRWTNLRDKHELYCAGHLFEAAAAHFQATGKRSLLNVALRFADHIDSLFGEGEEKSAGYPGHPEIELALFKLYNVTQERRYLDLARFFVTHRGQGYFADEHGTPWDEYNGEYWQDHAPIAEHSDIVGHAVRAGYLYSAVVDIAGETGDSGLLTMAQRVWNNTVAHRMYITGGLGSSAHNEGFTEDYDLPNKTAYQETCASVAMMMFSHRLNLVSGDGKYADAVERALYNGFLAGVSLDGKRYFYVNPLESDGGHHRQEWFGCACCPPNVSRTLAALGGYAYAVSERSLYVNLYIQGAVNAAVFDSTIRMNVYTDYPWDGRIAIEVQQAPAGPFAIHLRVPGWCDAPAVSVNGADVELRTEMGYVILEREWNAGDAILVNLPMPVRRMAAHPKVLADRGCIALMRGPLVYCLEDADHDDSVAALSLPLNAPISEQTSPDLLGGVVTLHAEGQAAATWPGGLYHSALPPETASITAIPYYAWDNRAAGAMRVWIPVT